MSRLNWHARDHGAALDGMLSLTLEERGAYNTVLDLIYSRQGPIPDDARWLAGWMQCSVRKWASLRATLIAKGKLYVTDDGKLANARADFELEKSARISRDNAEAGSKGGRKTAETKAKPNENNGMGQAPAAASLKLVTVHNSTENPEANASGRSDPDEFAWREGVRLLVEQGGVKEPNARALIGKLIKDNGLSSAKDLLPVVASAIANQTKDPRAYLIQGAKGIAARRAPMQTKRAEWC